MRTFKSFRGKTVTGKQFTLTDVGRILNVPPRRVSIWFDAGRLRGTRNNYKRHVSAEQLTEFVATYGTEFGLTSKGQTTC